MIVNDTEVVTTEMAEMAVLWIGAIIDGSYFSYQLAHATSIRWASLPVGYIAFAIVTSQAVSPNFGMLFSLKTKAETSLRAAFSNLRINVEAIAAFGGGGYGSFDIIWDHLARISHLCATRHPA